jgi:hypothetical protein
VCGGGAKSIFKVCKMLFHAFDIITKHSEFLFSFEVITKMLLKKVCVVVVGGVWTLIATSLSVSDSFNQFF